MLEHSKKVFERKRKEEKSGKRVQGDEADFVVVTSRAFMQRGREPGPGYERG